MENYSDQGFWEYCLLNPEFQEDKLAAKKKTREEGIKKNEKQHRDES